MTEMEVKGPADALADEGARLARFRDAEELGRAVDIIERLGQRGPSAGEYAQLISQTLHRCDLANVHQAAIEALRRIGNGEPEVILRLADYVVKPDTLPSICDDAMALIGEIGDKRSRPLLELIWKDLPDPRKDGVIAGLRESAAKLAP